jgi:2-polyprenyl-3-methyl-5-hydroxy-6-metoxy-1,4-benzoquinol methylase
MTVRQQLGMKKIILNRSTRQNIVKILSPGSKLVVKTVTKYLKKRTNPNIHTNKLLALIILVTKWSTKFTTLLRVIHNHITNSNQIQPKYSVTMEHYAS